jgi:colicin import membrane protein
LDRLRAEVERLNKALAERPTWPERAAMLAKIEAAEDLAGEWKAEADKYLDNIENRGRELTRVVARCLARIASKRAADMMAARKRAQAQAAADAQAEAERAKLAAQAAANAAALDRPATTTAGAGGRGAARRRWVAEVTDAAAVPRAYCLPDEKRIGREVRAGTLRELPGVRIYEVEDLAVSDS